MDEQPDLEGAQVISVAPDSAPSNDVPDLSTAVPIQEDVAQRARDTLNKVSAGELDLAPAQIQQLITSAMEGKGPWQRAGEWTGRLLDPLINPVTGAKMLYSGVTGLAKQGLGVIKEQAQIEKESEGVPFVAEAEMAKRLGAGALRGIAGLATTAAGAASEIGELTGLDTPENAAGLYQFQHDIHKAINQTTGVSPESELSKTGELIPLAALPIGAEAKLAPTIAKAADVAVETAPKVIGKTISGTAKAGQVVGPAVAAGELANTGHPIMALGTLLAGYTPARYGWIGSIKHAIIDQGLGAVKTFGQAMADKPYGVPILKGVQNDLRVEATKLETKLADMRASAGEGKLSRVDKFGPDGTPLYDLEELSPAEKEIRLNQDKLKNAREGIDKIEPYAQANRVLTDAAKYGLQTVGNLGVAETTGAAFTSAGAPPGDVEAQRAGQEMGLAFGLPGLHRANVSGRLEMLRNEMIGKGKKLISEDQLLGLTPEQRDSIYAHAAEVAPLGGKIEIVSPDEIIKRASSDEMPPEKGAVAPNGMFDPTTNTIVINKDAIASGVIGHEFTHLADEQLGLAREKFSQDIQDRIDSGSEAYKEFAKNYEERIRASDPSYPDLTPEQINEEVKAEIGRLIKLHMPPETFYGGKGGATIIKDWVSKLFNKDNGQIIGTVDGFGAPYTRGDINALKDVFYDIGEKARSGEKVSPGVTTAEPQEKQATELLAKPTVPSNIASDAASALKGLGISDPGPKVEAAIQELGPDATLEDVVRKATQRAVPKDLSGISLMPASRSDTIDRPASKISDLIFPGTPRQAKVAAKKYGLSDVEIESTHQPGFVTQGGAFLSPEEARLHGEERGQLPESTKDKLTPEDLASERLFMPSTHPDAIDKPAMRRKSDGKVFVAKSADTPHWMMPNETPELKDRYTLGGVDRYEDGWVTNDGEFLDKKEGHARAIEKKQINPGFRTEYKGALSSLDFNEGRSFMPSVPDKLDALGEGLLSAGDERGGTFLKNLSAVPGIENSINLDELSGRAEDVADRLSKSDHPAISAQFNDIRNRVPQFMPAPDPSIDKVVRDYTDRAGIKYIPHDNYRPLDESYSKEIADRYEELKHNPNDPEVRKAYDAFRDGIMGQYQTLLDHGYKIEPWPNEGQPYANSADMLKDLRNNKHLYYFETERGYGEKGGSTPENHPMLRGSGIFFNGKEALVNDIFRGVHDAIGHGNRGFQFGPRGEYNAFLEHASTLPPESHPALATETIGQNSWTNFGPHMRDANGDIIKPGEPGYVPLPERPFTEQRANLLKLMPSTISADEVNGTNSRPVSPEEFSKLREDGKAALAAYKKSSSPTTALDKNWDNIKDRAWNEAQKSWGGLAIDSHTGESKIGPIGIGGEIGNGPFGVTAKEPGQSTIEIPEDATREQFDAAMDRAKKDFPQLEHQNYHLSVFHDNGKGTIDIDPTVIVPDSATAEAVGAYTHAIGGIYDFSSGNGLYPPHVAPEGTVNAPESRISRPDLSGVSIGPATTKLDSEPFKGKTIEVGEEPWSIRLKELTDKEWNGSQLTDAEENELVGLHKEAVKNYGSYQNWFEKMGGEKDYLGKVFGESSQKDASSRNREQQFMPSDEDRLSELEAQYKKRKFSDWSKEGQELLSLRNQKQKSERDERMTKDPFVAKYLNVDKLQEGDIGSAPAPSWITPDGKKIEVDSKSAWGYHDETINEFSHDESSGAIKSDALVGRTGAVKITTSGSVRYLDDYGGNAGVTIAKDIPLSSAQRREIASLAQFRDSNEDALDLGIDKVDQDGKIVDSASFSSPYTVGQVMRWIEGEGSQFMPAPHIEREAERLGLSYDGNTEYKGTVIHNYTDPITKSTIAVKQDAERGELQKKLTATRDLFKGGLSDVNFMPAMHEGFYSPLEKHLEDKMPNKVSPEQLSGILAKSPVKKAELEWTGINDLIDQAKKEGRQITKEEAVAFVRANTPEIKEVSKLYGSGSRLNETKYSQHALPGGENYRELLMTLPPTNEDGLAMKLFGKQFSELTPSEINQIHASPEMKFPFRSTHFDEPNIVGHLRVNDRTLPDGSKMLFAEEIQSDWAQQGRKEGYKTELPPGYTVDKLKDGYIVRDADGKPYKSRNGNIHAQPTAEEAIAYATRNTGGVPDMPFKREAWKKLLLRNLIRHAVEEGYSSVGWTTGEQQAERYDLSKHIDGLGWQKFDNGRYGLRADKNNESVIDKTVSAEELPNVIGKELSQKVLESNEKSGYLDGLDLKVGGEGMKGFYDKELVNLANDIGKKFGAKVTEGNISTEKPFTRNHTATLQTLAADPPNRGLRYQIVDKSTGNVLETFDQSVDAWHEGGPDPDKTSQKAQEALAKYGETVTPETKVWKMDITPEMRESVQTHGQPMFMPSVSDPWSKIHEHLTEEERASIRDRDKQKIIDVFNRLPSIAKGVKTALAGQDARNWYRNSAEAISNTFGPDADRFAALLAALSPQVSVETNLQNAVAVWNRWLKNGRPADKESITNIVSESVIQGKAAQEKGESSALGAWMNNSIRSLSHDDPATMKLSGPKVDSFMRNLRNETQEVTNDRWMGRYGTGDIRMFKQPRIREGLQTKGFTYLAMNAHIRKIAGALTKRTGENWSPAETQAAIWSWVKSRADNVPVADVPEFSKLLRETKSLDKLEEPENPF